MGSERDPEGLKRLGRAEKGVERTQEALVGTPSVVEGDSASLNRHEWDSEA